MRALLILVGLCVSLAAHTCMGEERPDDVRNAYELQAKAKAITAWEKTCLPIMEAASNEDRFNLYYLYTHTHDVWRQIDFLRTLLDLANSASAGDDDRKTRRLLQDHAKFAGFELEQAIVIAEKSRDAFKRSEHLKLQRDAYVLLRDIRGVVNRLEASK